MKEHNIESRREILKVERVKDLSTRDPFFTGPGVVREYFIIHNSLPMMWIRESFPIDDRWKLV